MTSQAQNGRRNRVGCNRKSSIERRMREKVVRIASDARTGCVGWFLLKQGALAGFTEPACTGWFLLNQGVLAGFNLTSWEIGGYGGNPYFCSYFRCFPFLSVAVFSYFALMPYTECSATKLIH